LITTKRRGECSPPRRAVADADDDGRCKRRPWYMLPPYAPRLSSTKIKV
jgi:hypothetical protein